MNKGRIEQCAAPVDIYENPRSTFVASFIGDTNLVECMVESNSDAYCQLGITNLPSLVVRGMEGLNVGDKVRLLIRPEYIHILTDKPEDSALNANIIPGTVMETIYLGQQTKYRVVTGQQVLSVVRYHNAASDNAAIRNGDVVWLQCRADKSLVLAN